MDEREVGGGRGEGFGQEGAEEGGECDVEEAEDVECVCKVLSHHSVSILRGGEKVGGRTHLFVEIVE